MVRLKDSTATILSFDWIFQFHYGTIKSPSRVALAEAVPYFNSTMVRLKVVGGPKRLQELVFQFHYGTIKRLSHFSSYPNPSSFQFHYGTIKSQRKHQRPQIIIIFQFHYGTIKRATWARTYKNFFLISIPLWYD